MAKRGSLRPGGGLVMCVCVWVSQFVCLLKVSSFSLLYLSNCSHISLVCFCHSLTFPTRPSLHHNFCQMSSLLSSLILSLNFFWVPPPAPPTSRPFLWDITVCQFAPLVEAVRFAPIWHCLSTGKHYNPYLQCHAEPCLVSPQSQGKHNLFTEWWHVDGKRQKNMINVLRG